MLELYYNKQVEKIKSDYYTNGDDQQNMLHFIADTNKFGIFSAEVYMNALVDVVPYNRHVDGYGKVDESRAYQKIGQKMYNLKKLYCEVHNISLNILKYTEEKYQPAIISPLDDFEYYKRLTGGNSNVFDAANKDIIVIASNKDELSKDDNQTNYPDQEVKYYVDHYKSTDNNVSLGYSKTKTMFD
jgi:hypothetical protein